MLFRSAGRCNYARNLDGVGFSKFDADFGHALAGADPTTWTPKQTVAAYKLATKYRRQLAEMGLPIESIEAPPEELAQVVERQKVAAKRKVVRYDGSLTSPPCTEGVRWHLLLTPQQLSATQLGALAARHGGNARPVQPLNGRTVVVEVDRTSGVAA